jgi:hypothetical protein
MEPPSKMERNKNIKSTIVVKHPILYYLGFL